VAETVAQPVHRDQHHVARPGAAEVRRIPRAAIRVKVHYRSFFTNRKRSDRMILKAVADRQCNPYVDVEISQVVGRTDA
jgi:hypothetical protein